MICVSVKAINQCLMDWYVLNVNKDKNFSQLLEAMTYVSAREISTCNERTVRFRQFGHKPSFEG